MEDFISLKQKKRESTVQNWSGFVVNEKQDLNQLPYACQVKGDAKTLRKTEKNL